MTWTQLVGLLYWRDKPPKIEEWHVKEKWMVDDEYQIYLGARIEGELYIVGGIVKGASSAGDTAYTNAIGYLRGFNLQPEIRPANDPILHDFIGSVRDFYKKPKGAGQPLTYSLDEIARRTRIKMGAE